MTKLVFLISVVSSINLIGNHSAQDQTLLLSSVNSKSWYLYTSLPESTVSSCKSSSKISLDNTYTFYANGTFEFDHGTVIEDPSCQDEGCCSDFINLSGTWKFTNDQTGIVITALNERGYPDHKVNIELYNGTISELTESSFKISQVDPETKVLHTIEFRKK